MVATSFGLILVVALFTADRPMLDKLAAEAETRKAEHPERWKQYQQQAEGVFADHAKLLSQWRKRSSPPPPDLTSLKLPLAFLVDALRQEVQRAGKPQQGKPVRGLQPPIRPFTFLTAMVHSADERRLPALLEYQDQYLRRAPENKAVYSWGKLLADAATIKWAAARIPELVKSDPPLDYNQRFDHLLYCLIDRFASELPADTEKAAYGYVRKQTRGGPTSYNTEQLWHVLFRLDARQAGKDILPYFATPSGASLRYNYHVVVVLAAHPGASPEVAAAVRHWFATEADLNDFNKRQLRVVLLRADPERELGPTVKHIDQLLAKQRENRERFEGGGDVQLLLLAMAEVESPKVEESLSRYVFDRAIDTGVRFLILQSLVKHRYVQSPELGARWLREEPEHMQSHFRKEASSHWGAFGSEVLEKAERLNKRSKSN